MITCYTVHMTVHMTHDGCNCYFSFWAIFYPSPPPNNPDKENIKKKKKNEKSAWRYHHFTQMYQKS